MSTEPAWKKRTRPCPFYSQGKCLFADSCNFLHDAKLKAVVDADALALLQSSRNSRLPSVPYGLATVTAYTPAAIRSPPRSPRMSSLLSVLEDVIGPDDAEPLAETPGSETATVRPSGGDLPSARLSHITYNGPGHLRSVSDSDSGHGSSDDGHSPNLPTPVSSGEPSGESTKDFSPGEQDVFTSGRLNSKSFDLLSPVELGNVIPLSGPFPHDDVPLRESSTDSGYGENWAGPVTFALSPPPRHQPKSTFDLLASPFGSSSKPLFPAGTSSNVPSPSMRPMSPRKADSIESIDDDVPPLPLAADNPTRPSSFDSSSAILNDSFELIRSPMQMAQDINTRDVQQDTTLPQPILADAHPTDSSTDADISWEDSFSSNVSHERLSFPIPPSSLPIPKPQSPEEPAPAQHFSPYVPALKARFSLAQVMKDSLAERAARAQRRWSQTRALAEGTLIEEVPDDQIEQPRLEMFAAHTPPLMNAATSELTECQTHTPGLAYLDAADEMVSPTSQRQNELQPAFSPTLQQAIQPAAEAEESERDDTVTGMFDSFKFSPEQAAAKRMSWATSSRAMSPVGDDSSPTHSPHSDEILRPQSTMLSFKALDDYERVLEDELARDENGASNRSRARVRTVSPPTSISLPSSRTGSRSGSFSRPGSASSQRVFRRPGSLLVPRRDSDSRMPSPLSFTREDVQEVIAPRRVRSSTEGARVTSPSSAVSSRSESHWDTVGKSKKVPFGFRSSFKGKPIQTRSRPSITTTDFSTLSHQESTHSSESISSPALPEPPASTGLRPLRLSHSSMSSRRSSTVSERRRESITSSSNISLSQSHLLSSVHASSSIPAHTQHSNHSPDVSNVLSHSSEQLPTHNSLQSAPLQAWRHSVPYSLQSSPSFSRPSSRQSETYRLDREDDLSDDLNVPDGTTTIRRPLHIDVPPLSAPTSTMVYESPATPAPTLMFAIASNQPESVRAALEQGASPDEDVGPQSALAFALTNEQLSNRLDIVKALLAYGADPATLRDPARNPPHRDDAERDGMFVSPPPQTSLELMDPATRYYITRADAPHTRRASALVQRSFFRPLTRARYDIIGQDRAFEQLFLALNLHSRAFSVSPVVIIFCGPSGHGKSFLARRFASLLSVPIHTLNVTTLRHTQDLWQSYSMSPYEEPSNCTLAQFLLDNEGKRCVVVLDEIEKTVDSKVLYPLLMPWEQGRCFFKAGDRHVDVRNVIWIGTSNVGQELVAAHGADGMMSREDYLKLTDMLRPMVSDRLGASLISRVAAILPFVPFTEDEQLAIATEALFTLGGDLTIGLSVQAIESIARSALERYIPDEGARSLYRAVSSLLLNISDYSGAE